MIDKTVVEELDIQQYLGTWYEIARYDHSFERGLVGVTAEYSMRDDGKIRVINSGYKNSLDGEFSQAEGKAKIPNPEKAPAKLKVAFFLFFYGDYFVMELDKDYKIRRHAVDYNIPLITNARLASAFIYAFCKMDISDIKIKSWQEM